jgi:hypothetical protein
MKLERLLIRLDRSFMEKGEGEGYKMISTQSRNEKSPVKTVIRIARAISMISRLIYCDLFVMGTRVMNGLSASWFKIFFPKQAKPVLVPIPLYPRRSRTRHLRPEGNIYTKRRV